MARIRFMNTCIDNLTMDEALDRIEQLATGERASYVVTPNVDHIVRLEKDEAFRRAYSGADLILTDGMPLVWISGLLGTPIREKVSGSDLFPKLCERAAARGLTMFFLGAAEGVAAEAAENMQRKYPGLQVKGVYSPPFGFERDEAESERIVGIVKEAAPQILILALGSPKQEIFISENLKRMDVPVSLGLGAALDFAAGNIPRAPGWMQRCGLEWLFRLMREPRRLFRRYLIDDMRIFALTARYWRKRYEDSD